LKSARDATAEEKVKVDHELAVIKEAFEREKQKAKCHSWEKCDELIKHEDELEVKDIEIYLLKAKTLHKYT